MSRRKSLSVEVSEDLKNKIQHNEILAGEKLPTESELCDIYNVSRTVIREAVASLRSEKLLVSRQGIGVFVAESAGVPKFEVDWAAVKSLPETIALLEMRLAVEVEAAGLCALRCTKAQAKAIRDWMVKTDEQTRDIEDTDFHYDFDFHLAIAEGAGNAYFHRFLAFLQPIIVPRIKLNALVGDNLADVFYTLIHTEHLAIVEAIENRDADGARDAMRRHILSSLDRVHKLAASYGIDPVSQANESAESAPENNFGSVFPNELRR